MASIYNAAPLILSTNEKNAQTAQPDEPAASTSTGAFGGMNDTAAVSLTDTDAPVNALVGLAKRLNELKLKIQNELKLLMKTLLAPFMSAIDAFVNSSADAKAKGSDPSNPPASASASGKPQQ